MQRKLRIAGIVLLCLAFASGLAEHIFYGNRLDENDVLQESFFLPLTYILSFPGVILLIASLALKKR